MRTVLALLLLPAPAWAEQGEGRDRSMPGYSTDAETGYVDPVPYDGEDEVDDSEPSLPDDYEPNALEDLLKPDVEE